MHIWASTIIAILSKCTMHPREVFFFLSCGKYEYRKPEILASSGCSLQVYIKTKDIRPTKTRGKKSETISLTERRGEEKQYKDTIPFLPILQSAGKKRAKSENACLHGSSSPSYRSCRERERESDSNCTFLA